MKLKLFHKLFLLIAITALVASLAMASVMSWNLNRGFAGYLESRDLEMMDAYAGLISQQLNEKGGGEALKSGQLTLRSLHRDMIAQGVIADRGPDFRAERGPSDREGKPLSADQSIGNPPPPQGYGPPSFLAPRLLLFNADGAQIYGPPPPLSLPTGEPDMLQRKIIVDGETVGMVKMIPPGPAPSGVNAKFLRDQYVNAAFLVVVLMIFAGLSAWVFARAGIQRMATLENATTQIASGNFNVRTGVEGFDEIASMGHNINQMAESLARADQARRGWLAEIGHELRTPLTVLSGELEALQDGIRQLDQAAVRSLKEETERLGALIEDLHFMAVSDLTDAPSSFSVYDAITLFSLVTERFQPVLAKSGLSLEIDRGSETSLRVVWDGKRIEQLIGNLLTNAQRYTDAPGTVRIGISSAKSFIIITIEDSPPGVPETALRRLFEPLFRVDEARDRASGGSGLGLAVCKAIADAHGGKISAKKSDMGGLLVEIKLPMEAQHI